MPKNDSFRTPSISFPNPLQNKALKQPITTLLVSDVFGTLYTMIFGYARVSTEEQKLETQIEALKKAGAERIFSEKLSGKASQRPALEQLILQLREGDIVLVWKLDRLARTTIKALELVETIDKAGGALKSLTEPIDMSDPIGRAAAGMLFVFAELERSNIRERTKAGIQHAAQQGRTGGRPSSLSPNQQTRIRRRHKAGESIAHLAREYRVSRQTIGRCLKGS